MIEKRCGQSVAPLNLRSVGSYPTELATASVDLAEPLQVVGRGRPISEARARADELDGAGCLDPLRLSDYQKLQKPNTRLEARLIGVKCMSRKRAGAARPAPIELATASVDLAEPLQVVGRGRPIFRIPGGPTPSGRTKRGWLSGSAPTKSLPKIAKAEYPTSRRG